MSNFKVYFSDLKFSQASIIISYPSNLTSCIYHCLPPKMIDRLSLADCLIASSTFVTFKHSSPEAIIFISGSRTVETKLMKETFYIFSPRKLRGCIRGRVKAHAHMSHQRFLASFAASTIASASFRFVAIGFSQRTCSPLFKAVMLTCNKQIKTLRDKTKLS